MPSSTSTKGWRRAGRYLVQLVILPIGVLLLLEGLSSAGLFVRDVRAIKPAGNFRHSAYDTLLGWAGLPNLHDPDYFGPGISLSSNADGMRTHVVAAQPDTTATRHLICSGDSFTLGSGVADSETFCADLEHDFPGLHTYNMAQQGYGIDQAYLWYRRDGIRYPHQVHLFAFIWNDFERMALTSFTGYPKPRLALRSGRITVQNVPVPHWSGVSSWPQVAGLLPELRLVQLVERRANLTDEVKMRRTEATVLPVAHAVFRDLHRLDDERGSQLVLVYLPTLQDVDPGPLDLRRDSLATFARAAGIPFIDLTPELRQVSADSIGWMFITPHALPVSWPSGHYSAAGHRWAADHIAAHLRAIPAVDSALTPPRR